MQHLRFTMHIEFAKGPVKIRRKTWLIIAYYNNNNNHVFHVHKLLQNFSEQLFIFVTWLLNRELVSFVFPCSVNSCFEGIDIL